ncbi:MAG: DUF302 domain-containing protein [Candidatus Solibacter usitatus]|nr:DUF302 domain-containing protein [Candidatus Solibacter usitatus]
MPEIELALRDSAARHKFGVIHIHDLQQTMKKKGVDFERQCFIFEVCNPHQAKKVLEVNGAVSSALPCRISAYETAQGLVLSTILPTAIMGMFGSPELAPIAVEVEAVMKAMIDESA